MSDIHYFQRYTSRENAVTNATLHLFSRIYEHSTKRLKDLLNEVFDADMPLGVEIRQQTRSSESVPDGFIAQAQVRIAIETKVDAGVSSGQLERHLKALGEGGEHYLLLLTKHEPNRTELARVAVAAQQARVKFVSCTFEELCAHLGKSVRDFELNLKPIVDDFIAYCDDMDLLPDRRALMRVVPCSQSFTQNRAYGIYYHPTSRGYTKQQFIGVYRDKSVRLIGEVKSVFDCTLAGGVLSKTLVSGANTDEFDAKIIAMIGDTQRQVGWDISSGHRFFCCGEFVETDYRKVSPYGIQGARVHDVSDFLKEAKTLVGLADLLRQKTWE